MSYKTITSLADISFMDAINKKRSPEVWDAMSFRDKTKVKKANAIAKGYRPKLKSKKPARFAGTREDLLTLLTEQAGVKTKDKLALLRSTQWLHSKGLTCHNDMVSRLKDTLTDIQQTEWMSKQQRRMK